MTTEKIFIENLKCHGCANTIRKEMMKFDGVSKVEIGMDDSSVNLEYDEAILEKDKILKRLVRIGYPEKGHNSLKSEVISYVSCAVGRMSKSGR
jgi:copper chaperone CopZ